jgi:hypothetical protein
MSSLVIEGVDYAETFLRVHVRTTTPEAVCPYPGLSEHGLWHRRGGASGSAEQDPMS